MAGLTPFQPDALYCVYCHAPAAGACATCRALVCIDCSVLTGGSVQKAAVCLSCHGEGRGGVGWRAWAPILLPVLAILFLLFTVVWLLD